MEEYPFNLSKCLNAKQVLSCNVIARNAYRNIYSHSDKIGNCALLFKILNPSSYDDFYNKYIQYASAHKDEKIMYRGLTYDELYATAQSYKKYCEDNGCSAYDLELYFYKLVCHIIYETYQGQNKERQFIKYINSLGYKCGKFDDYLDTKYGMDLKVENDNKAFAIQIKPISFFLGNALDLKRDQIDLCHKYEQALYDRGIKTFYAIYKINNKGEIYWLRNKNGFKFKIKELFDYDKNDIENTFKKIALKGVTQEKLPC